MVEEEDKLSMEPSFAQGKEKQEVKEQVVEEEDKLSMKPSCRGQRNEGTGFSLL